MIRKPILFHNLSRKFPKKQKSSSIDKKLLNLTVKLCPFLICGLRIFILSFSMLILYETKNMKIIKGVQSDLLNFDPCFCARIFLYFSLCRRILVEDPVNYIKAWSTKHTWTEEKNCTSSNKQQQLHIVQTAAVGTTQRGQLFGWCSSRLHSYWEGSSCGAGRAIHPGVLANLHRPIFIALHQ